MISVISSYQVGKTLIAGQQLILTQFQKFSASSQFMIIWGLDMVLIDGYIPGYSYSCYIPGYIHQHSVGL